MLKSQDYALGFQHLLAMFGSTVLVPLITGLSPAVALFTAGVGTLLFHLCTKGMVPVFQGSSFAYIGALCTIIGQSGIPAAQSGIMAAGLVYLVLAAIVYFIGPDRLRQILPPIVTGPVIIIIGLSLTGVGVKDAFGFVGDCVFDTAALKNILIALFVFAVVMAGMNSRRRLFSMVPILLGILLGYVLCCVLSLCGIFHMDFSPIANAPWLNLPFIGDKLGTSQIGNPFSIPEFNLTAIVMIAPIALVTFMEHVGDITTNGAVVGKDFFKDPGLHRTLVGDGLATFVAGLLGGPANTTYSENTGVLATTKNYNPALLRVAAVFAIILGLVGKFGAVLQTIPAPVKGGIELILFGMIASVGIRTIAEAKLNMASTRNLCIMGSVLCAGIGLGSIGGISLVIHDIPVNISALFVATVVGVIMNAILPSDFDELIKHN